MSTDFRNGAARLARMTGDEFRVRAGQEFAKHWDAFGFARLQHKQECEMNLSCRFFFSVEELGANIAFFRERMPETVQATVARAERIRRHQFDLLGYEGLDYGPEIDWHLDAVSGKRAPLKSCFKIDYLDYSQVGDVKVTWELNRHQHLVTLAKAYCFTRDERFVEELIRQWYSWRQQNPYPKGVNWASSLEVAFRSISWLWIIHLLQKCALVSPEFKSDVQQALMLSGRHIERYLSTYFSPNTHLLGEGAALFFLGVLCNSRSAERWKQRGWNVVLAQAERQVQPDGMHFEQSIYYHVYALDLLLHTRILAAANRIPIPTKLDCTIERMLGVLFLLGRTGMPPRFGDDDGGRLFDPGRNSVEHLLDPLATGTVLFGRPDFKAVKPDLVEETVWLLGSDQARAFNAMPISEPQAETVALRSSGLYLMMSPGKPAAGLTIDAGPHGADGGGHGHADALSIQLAIGGRDVLVDPGTFVYASPDAERQIFRGTASHNTLQIDGVDQAEPAGPFPWQRLPEVSVENWTAGNCFDLLIAKHSGYARLANPVLHRRYVFGLKSQFWLVLDTVEGQGNHHADVFWHLASDLRWQLQENSALVIWEQGTLALLFADAHAWTPRIQEGWCSPVYGVRKRIEVLSFHNEGELREGIATLLLPCAHSTNNPGLLARLHHESANNTLRVYRYDRVPESHFFFFSAHQPWRWRELRSDAEFLYYSISESGHTRLFCCGATYVEVAGEPVISCSRILSRFEWSAENGQALFSCSDEDAVCSTCWEHLSSLERWAAEVAIV